MRMITVTCSNNLAEMAGHYLAARLEKDGGNRFLFYPTLEEANAFLDGWHDEMMDDQMARMNPKQNRFYAGVPTAGPPKGNVNV